MGLKEYSQEELADFSLVELTNLILEDENKATDYRDIFNKIVEIKQFSADQRDDELLRFYTDLNVDGRFMTGGSNLWGLKSWYSVDQFDEDVTVEPTKKRKKRAADEDEDLDDLEEDFTLDEEGFDEDFGDEEDDIDGDEVAEDDYEGDYQSGDTDEGTREVVDEDMQLTGDEDEDNDEEDR
ncbi:DNA-directed RNA polymerase subunit delta [Terribacillus sp. DMT04]|uniref:DNA-directed RNA polymerase subunit delta n=1 Tax=Terribacillus sp. DMT04 TaxID=2850441 RepID=UPI001C2C4C9F|nr:DNA-directed RNA polymerase subunit delta [Terribacillus sp. DMT04]QXE01176.1 DNA-directed RNA polymerase subunit delta [Terribacillus sp. DMT04]